MAQPYFTNQPVPIQQVSPELLMAPGRAMGRAFEKLGQSVGVAMERQYQKQEKARRADELENYLIGQGIDPDMAKSLKNDKELALNKLKLDQEDEKFRWQQETQRKNMEYQQAMIDQLAQATKQKEEAILGRKQAREAQRKAVSGEGRFADTLRYLQDQKEMPVSQYAADKFIQQNDPTSPLPYTYTAPPKPTSLDVILKQEMTSDAKTQFDKWTKHSNELSSLENALLRTENPIDRAKIKRKIDYKTKFLERAENRINKLEKKNEFFKGKPKEEFTESYINKVLAQQGLASPEQQRRIIGEKDAFDTPVEEIKTTTQKVVAEKGLDPTPQNIYLEALADPNMNEYAVEELRKQIPKMDLKTQKQLLEMEKAMLDIKEKRQALMQTDFSDIPYVEGEFTGDKQTGVQFKKDLGEAENSILVIDKLLNLQKKAKKDGWSSELRAEGDTLVISLRSSMKPQVIGTGAVSEGEREILFKAIPQPTEFKKIFMDLLSKDKIRLETLRDNTYSTLNTKMGNFGIKINPDKMLSRVMETSRYSEPKDKVSIDPITGKKKLSGFEFISTGGN